jgi:hypothetical protein
MAGQQLVKVVKNLQKELVLYVFTKETDKDN